MSTITSVRAYLVDLPVEAVRTDAVQSFHKQETIFVEIGTDDGLAGRGSWSEPSTSTGQITAALGG